MLPPFLNAVPALSSLYRLRHLTAIPDTLRSEPAIVHAVEIANH
jgi:hypothetical protein